MWIANRWEQYKVLDTSAGEKVENWNGYKLVRPDPQVIWNTKKPASIWKGENAHYHRSSKGGGEWEFFDLPEEWKISYELEIGERLTFALKPFSFKHTGLFPEQAVNWDWFSSIINKAVKDGHKSNSSSNSTASASAGTGSNSSSNSGTGAGSVKVLNLFAYTGGATLAAAEAGAQVTHVDASKGMVNWAKENAALSGLSDRPIRWLVDDCVKFVEREIRRGNHYDAIIMDPPSYGRGPKGEIWKIEEAIYPLVELCSKLLSDNPLFFLINSYTTGLQPAVLSYMISVGVKEPLGLDGKVTAEEIGLPVESRTIAPSGATNEISSDQASNTDGLVLPCGASGRWER